MERSASVLPLFIAVLLIPAALGSSATIFNDGDVSWHIAAGQWILDHRAIPHADPFSFTWLDRPWVPIEWLAEVVYASAYRLAGFGGVAAVVTAALIALHALLYGNAVRSVRPWLAVGVTILVDVVLIPMLLARPHLLAWPLMALWTWLMLRAREQDRAPPLVAALLMTLWANLHGSFLMGLAIAGAFGLEALVASPDKQRAFRQWLVFGLACATAVFINGNGVAGVLHPFEIVHLRTLTMIDEWKPSNPAVTPFFFGVLALMFALAAWKRPTLHPVRWLLLGLLLAAALMQMRHQAVLAIVAAMVLPDGFARGSSRPSSSGDRRALVVAGAGALLLIFARAVMPMSVPDTEDNPHHLIAMIPPALRSQPVINGYAFGGPLILAGIRPYIDGRNDMYGDALITDYLRIIHGDPNALAAAERRWNIRWAMLPNGSKLIPLLNRLPDWRLLGRDKVGAIYVRTVPSA